MGSFVVIPLYNLRFILNANVFINIYVYKDKLSNRLHI